MSKTMKAAVVRTFGEPLRIEEVPVPEVQPGMIQVAVAFETAPMAKSAPLPVCLMVEPSVVVSVP